MPACSAYGCIIKYYFISLIFGAIFEKTLNFTFTVIDCCSLMYNKMSSSKLAEQFERSLSMQVTRVRIPHRLLLLGF